MGSRTGQCQDMVRKQPLSAVKLDGCFGRTAADVSSIADGRPKLSRGRRMGNGWFTQRSGQAHWHYALTTVERYTLVVKFSKACAQR